MMNSKIPLGREFLSFLVHSTLAAGLACGMSTATADPSARLLAKNFSPADIAQARIAGGLDLAERQSNQSAYYVVQLTGPVQRRWRQQIADAGGEILHYLPDDAFKVRMTPATAQRVAKLTHVAWIDAYQPALKLNPAVKRNGTRLFRVKVEQGANAGMARQAIARTGASVMGYEANRLIVQADSRQLDGIARIPDVAWIENFLLREKHNDYAAGVIMGANTANIAYSGNSQIVAIADTGLGDGTPATAHVDLPAERIKAIHNWPGSSYLRCWTSTNDGASDEDSGHGTHVTLSALGGGDPSGLGRGAAPGAQLVFQAVENFVTFSRSCSRIYGTSKGYYLMGLPEDLTVLFQQAYDEGARIHSNSWGSASNGDYTLDAQTADAFIWQHPDMTITFSAGNDGVDDDADGIIDAGSVGSPATAKNVITVGASENNRDGHWECNASAGCMNDLFAYGESWSEDYPADPIAGDATAGNQEQMAAFSSRGPTQDGRIKPDVVAPGAWILSGYAGTDNGWGSPYNGDYKYLGGTSMSNPLVAGGAAVIRDYYQMTHEHAASAALVKATLINTAADMLDENNDGVDDNAFPIPNIHEGWGRVDLIAATDGSRRFIDDATGLNDVRVSKSYNIEIGSDGEPFKITLAWTDYPSSPDASSNLVNDLDLRVTAPDGTTYLGNNFSLGWSSADGNADRVNNVENVYINSATSGEWQVEVIGYNIPEGPQPFSLVLGGAF